MEPKQLLPVRVGCCKAKGEMGTVSGNNLKWKTICQTAVLLPLNNIPRGQNV